MTEKLDLTALLGSRICHDLISPIGAIGNGVELMLLDGGARSPELQLIADSVAHANARIRFFRIAFGMASTDQHMGRPEVVGVLQDLTRGGRLSIDWHSQSDLPRREVKLAFLAIQCLEGALPHGGVVVVERSENRWSLRAEAARLRIDPQLWALVTHGASSGDITPAQVHFLLLRDELSRQNRRLVMESDEATLRLSF